MGAARKLHDLGHEVHVLEARNRLGGRVLTSHELGAPVDLGASLMTGSIGNPCYVMCKQLGMELTDIEPNPGNNHYYYDGSVIDIDTFERMSQLWLLLEECSEILANSGLFNEGNHCSEQNESHTKWAEYYRNLIREQSYKISSDLNIIFFLFCVRATPNLNRGHNRCYKAQVHRGKNVEKMRKINLKKSLIFWKFCPIRSWAVRMSPN